MSDAEPDDPQFEALINYIQQHRDMDFRGYKRTSLRRRVTMRMRDVGVADFASYQGLLEADPQEFTFLLNTILINVTSFFRDPDAWEVLRRDVVPTIIQKGDGNGPIRIWSVGCASGQEPYSVAMMLAEQMGVQEFCRRSKIYATDLDEEALQTARHAIYTPRDVEGLSAELLERYFEPSNGNYAFQRELRKCIIFGRHNVVVDAPISRVDLVLCRNVLIYLEAETQEIVLPRLHYALAENGTLFLGKAESQLARSRLFAPVDSRHRIFRKTGREWRRTPGGSIAVTRDPYNSGAPTFQLRLLEAVMDYSPVAYLAVDIDGRLALANSAARRILAVGEADIGRPFNELAVSYRPPELRSRIEEASAQLHTVRLEHQDLRLPTGDPLRVTIDITPLLGSDGKPFATLLSFSDTTRLSMLQQELEAAQESLETTIEELQSANEELETTNEELQSSNEELETTNEELQSTNEELETMNEELRSTNEELEAANTELREQSEEAARYRRHSEAVLGSLNTGVVVLDDALRVRSWNRWCENMWGLREEEVQGEELHQLDIGLPVQQLEEGLRKVLRDRNSAVDTVLDGVDRRGRSVRCRVRGLPLIHQDRTVQGAILLMEDLTETERSDAYARYLGRILGQSLNEIYFLEPQNLRFTLINQGAEVKLGYRLGELRQRSLADLMPFVSRDAMQSLCAPLLAGEIKEVVFETMIRARSGRDYPAEICLQYFDHENPPFILAIVHDTSERQQLGRTAEDETIRRE